MNFIVLFPHQQCEVNVECNGGIEQKRNSAERTTQGDGEGVCICMMTVSQQQQHLSYRFYRAILHGRRNSS